MFVPDLMPYNDWANDQLLVAGETLTDEQLDRRFKISVGTFRKLLLHVYIGEYVWLRRWQGESDQPWLDQNEKIRPGQLAERFAPVRRERDAFLAALDSERLARPQRYLDSKGSYFTAPLGEMLVQGFVHSTHHRAQLVNMLRRLNAGAPELDYMMWCRRPA